MYIPLLISILISVILTPIIIRFANRFNFLKQPSNDRWHKKPTPYFGGISIYLSFTIPYIMFSPHNNTFYGILIGSSLIFLLGLIDDIISIKPITKLAGEIIISSIVIYFGIVIEIIPYKFISIPLTILWIISITNAFNLLDNMDGLSSGIAFISSIIISIYSIINNNIELARVSLLISGGSLGFLIYNFNPAKIFMGDCGSLFLGYILSTITIAGTWKDASNLIITLFVPLLILAVPIFDTATVTLIRKINGRAISQGGRDHISHRLVALGLSERKTVLILYSISIFLGGLAILQNRTNQPVMIILIILLFLILYFFGRFLANVNVYSDNKGKSGLLGKLANNQIIFEILIDLIIISISYISSYMLRFEGGISKFNIGLIKKSLPFIAGTKLLSFIYFGLYRNIWKYTGIRDLISIFKACSLGSILSVMILVIIFRFEGYSRALFVIDWLISMILISGARIAMRFFDEYFRSLNKGEKRVLIIGAGDAGELTLREIRKNKESNYRLIGFIDDDVNKIGKSIHGVSIIGTRNNIIEIVKKHMIDEVIIAIPSLNEDELVATYEELRRNNVRFRKFSSILS